MKYLSFCLSVILLVGLTNCGNDDGGSVLSKENGILTFSLKDIDQAFTVDTKANTVTNAVGLLFGFDASKLVATFTVPKSASVTVGGVKQVSGETVNDFSKPVTYTVAAADPTITSDFVVTVNISKTAWSKIATDPFVTLTKPSAFAHDNKLWLVGAVELNVIPDFGKLDPGSYFEYVYSSADGVTWEKTHNNTKNGNDSIPFGTFSRAIAYNGKLVNVGGISGPTAPDVAFFLVRKSLGVAASSDGKKWTATVLADAGIPVIVNAQLLENNNSLFIVGGQGLGFGQPQSISSMDIYKSTNGTTFQSIGTGVLSSIKKTPAPPTLYASTVFKGAMYIAGGASGVAFPTETLESYSTSVYKSTDGITWTVASAAGFPKLVGTQIVEYKEKLYAIGGITPKTDGSAVEYTRDIYVSEDAITWTLVTGGLALPKEFKGRGFHNVVVMNDKIYIIGGEDTGATSVNDVWVGEF